MDFEFTKEQDLLRSSVREWADAHLAPKVAQMEETAQVPLDVVRAMGEMGYFGITIPVEFGGSALGYLARTIVLEELARVNVAMAYLLQVQHLGTEPILRFGSAAQKEKYLPALATSDVAAIAVTEPSGGSDPLAVSTTAVKDGDGWVLNGRKCMVTNSHIASVLTIMAKTGEGAKGFSGFLIDKGIPGFRATREEHKIGLRGCNTGELEIANCRLPYDSILGQEGDGLKIGLQAISEVGRAGIAACALGVLQACLDASTKFAKERVLYGAPIAKLQAIQFKIAEMALDLDMARLLCYRASWLKDNGKRCDQAVARGKLFSTEAAVVASKKTMDIFGGYGCMMEYIPQRLYRDAQVLVPSAGTSEIMKLIIARSALG